MVKPRYEFAIRKPICKGQSPGCKWEACAGKTCGDNSYSSTHCKDVGEIIQFMERAVKHWREYNAVLGRKPDKVTEKNLAFESCIKTITKGMLLNMIAEAS